MLNLSELVFKVNTEALVDAANKVAALGKSVDGLSSTFSKLEKSSSQASKAQAKAEKDLAAAEVDRAKAVDITAKTEERKAKAVRETAKATEEATAATKSSVSILERQQTILEFQANGYSKGQASILAYAKAAGVAATEIQEIGKVLQAQRTLMGGDPFDKSLGSLKSLQNEFKTLKEVQRLYTAEITLTRKQMENLALDKLRLIEAMKIEGRSMSDIKAAIKDLNVKYITTAQNINRVTQAENELDKARKDSANANAYLEKEMQRVNFALQAQNSELNKGTANALNRFEQNLKRSGLTLDQQRVKMEEYRKGLLALEKTKGGNTDYITRALGPQITDIFVGLATGQSPLTVMLQQGGQLRDQFALAGVAADDMGAKMRTAAKDMVVSVAAVARAFGDLLIGAFIDAGKGVVNFVSQIALVDKVTEGAKRRLAAMGDEGFAYIGKLEKFAGVIAAGIGITLAATIAAVVALGVALKQVTTEQNELAKSLNLTGAALGMSSKEVVAFAQGLDSVKTSAAIEFINELSKAGVRTSKDIAGLTEVAIDLEKYGGVALKETAKAYDDLQKKPFEALMKIAEGTGQVSKETIDMAVEMKLAGDEVGLLNLAQKEFVRANKAAVEAIKSEINPMTALWITVKDGITFAWEGLKNFARTGVVLEGVVKVLNTILTGVLAITTATRFAGKTLGGYLAIMGQVADGINPFSGVSASEALKNIQGIFSEYKADIKTLGSETSAAYDQIWNSVKTTTGLTDKARESNSAYATDTVKGMQDLEKAYNSIEKAELKKITRQQAINKALEDYKQKNKQASEAQLKYIEQAAGIAWDKANKQKGPGTARAALDIDRSNEIRLLEQQFEREASLRQKFTDDQMKVMKADYEMGYITKAEYLDKETALLRSTLAQQRADSEAVIKQREALYLQETQTLINAYNERVKANKGLKNSDEADARALEKLQVALMNSGREYENFIDKVKSKDSALASSLTAKEVEAMKVLYENVKKNNEAYAEYIRNNELRIQQRKEDIATADALRWATPEQAAVIKAVADEVKHYGAELSKFQRIAKEAKETMDDTIGRFGVMSPQAQVAIKQYNTAMDRVNQVIADERVAKEQAATDAILEYYKNEYKRISDGITDSIVTALFEGGKAGSKKLRDLIMSELRKPVTIVVQAVVNTLLGSVIGGLTGSSGGGIAGSVASSLGGSAITQGLGLSGLTSGITTAISAGFKGATLAPGLMGPTTAGATGLMGLGNTLAAIPGWGWAIAGIAALAGLMSKKATPHAGAGSTFSAAGGLQNINLGAANNMGFMANYAKETQGLTDQIAKTLVTALDSTAKSFGTTAGYAVSAAFADDTSKDGAWGQLIIKKLGVGDIVNWGLESVVGKWAPKEFADGAEGQQQYMNAIAKSARDALKSAIGDVRWAQNMFDALGDNPTIEQLSTTVDQINQAQTAITTLGKNIQGFASMTNDAISSLVEASGGAQAFFANMQSFYENFYSDSEKVANQSRDIADALSAVGLVLPKTRDEYRQLVEQQLALGESGSKAAAVLLQYSGAFASITESQQDLVQAEKDRIEKYKDQQRDLLNVQISAAEEQMNLYQKFFDFLDGEIKKLYGSAEATSAMQVRDARAIIDRAQRTGTLPDYETLTSAVDVITGSMTSNKYTSRFEMERDKLKFAGQLDDLRDTADKNLKSAKNSFDVLKLQLASLDQLTVTATSQLNALYSIEDAIREVGVGGTGGTGVGGTGSTRPQQYGGGTSAASGSGSTPRAAYGADEALTSFEKFKAWYQGIRNNADPKTFMNEGYQVPDWMRVHKGAADATDNELFGSYLFFKNNPEYAKDFEQVYSTGRSSYATDGSTLVRSDLAKMPEEIAKYYKANLPDLLAAEGFGLDPVLAYQLYNFGPGQFGLDQKKQSFTEWLQNNKWTESGIVSNYNLGETAAKGYSNYRLARWDTSTGNIVNVDGKTYTPDGKYIGMASSQQMQAIFGSAYKQSTSALYQAQVGSGNSTAEGYYADIKNNLDAAIAAGWSAQQLADAVRETGASLQDVATAYGIPVSQVRDNLIAGGATDIPAFAKGGKYDGGMALVGERGPELINFNSGGYVANATQTRAAMSNSALCDRMEALEATMSRVSVETQATAIAVIKVSKILDRVSPDGQSLNVTVV